MHFQAAHQSRTLTSSFLRSRRSMKQPFLQYRSQEKSCWKPILDPTASSNAEKVETRIQEANNVATDTVKERQKVAVAEIPAVIEDNGKSEIAKRNINEEYFVVRILKDLPTFNAVDKRNYTTHAEDVVVLPAMNANVLVKRGAAHLITKIINSN